MSTDSKSINCMIIDLGPNMAQADPLTGTPHIDRAVNLARSLYSHRMMHYPEDRCGLIMSGAAETNNPFPNDTSKQYLDVGLEIDKISSQQLNAMQHVEMPPDADSNEYLIDITQSIALAQYLIKTNNDINTRLRFGKQIFLFTSLDTSLSATSPNQIQSLVTTCNDYKHIIHVYAADLMPYDQNTFSTSEECQLVTQWVAQCDEYSEAVLNGVQPRPEKPEFTVATEDDLDKWETSTGLGRLELTYILYYNINSQGLTGAERTAEYNRRVKELIFRSFAHQTKGDAWSFQQLQNSLHQPFHKPKMLRSKMNGQLALGTVTPQVNIQAYTFTSFEKIPSLSSWNGNPDKGGLLPDTAQLESLVETVGWQRDGKVDDVNKERIIPERVYTDNFGNVVELDQALLGLRYGKEDVIPINAQDKAYYDQPTARDLRILRIVKQEYLAPWFRCGSTDLITPAKDCVASQHVMTRLAEMCKDRGLACLVRYVGRANTKPQFGVLVPLIQTGHSAGFTFHQLPYSDDLRFYNNKPLYAQLTDEDVAQYNQWRQEYEMTYLQRYKEEFFEQMRDQYDPHDYKRPQTVDDITLDDMHEFLRGVYMETSLVGDGRIIIDPDQLKQDDDDVNKHKRYRIQNRFSEKQLLDTPSCYYVNPTVHSTQFNLLPWYMYSRDSLTKAQQCFASYTDNLLLRDDQLDPAQTHNAGYQRFFNAIKDRILDPTSDPRQSIESVGEYFINTTLVDNPETTARLQAICEQLKGLKPVRVETVEVDEKGRKKYTKNTALGFVNMMKQQQGMLTGENLKVDPFGTVQGDLPKTVLVTEQDMDLRFNLGDGSVMKNEQQLNDDGMLLDEFNDQRKKNNNNNDMNDNNGKNKEEWDFSNGLSLPFMRVTGVTESSPIADFQSMLRQGDGPAAFEGMVKLLTLLTTRPNNGSKLTTIYHCLCELRSACIMYNVPHYYNNYFTKLAVQCKELLVVQHKAMMQQQRQNPYGYSFGHGGYGGYGGSSDQQGLTAEQQSLVEVWNSLQSFRFKLCLITKQDAPTSDVATQDEAFAPFKEPEYEQEPEQPQQQQVDNTMQQDQQQQQTMLNTLTNDTQNAFVDDADDFGDFDL